MPIAISRARALALASAAAAAGPRIAAAQPAPIRMGTTAQGDTNVLAFYAQEAGFFKRAGLDIDLQNVNNPSSTVAAVGSSLDVGFCDPPLLANAVNRGLPLVYFAGGSCYSAEAIRAWLEANGADIAQVKLIELPFTTMVRHSIAAPSAPPSSARASRRVPGSPPTGPRRRGSSRRSPTRRAGRTLTTTRRRRSSRSTRKSRSRSSTR